MSKSKTPNRTKPAAGKRKTTHKKLDTAQRNAELMSRVSDCRGAVAVAIGAILSNDPNEIDAAMGSLCLAERELQRLANDLDVIASAGAGKAAITESSHG